MSREVLAGEPAEVAAILLGTVLESVGPEGRLAVRITEVEAYAGESDPASHAYRGRTRRNAVMFGEPGHLYVYFTYGMHWCANVVCGPAGQAGAVLVRAGEVVDGVPVARSRRTTARHDVDLARGPARLATCLGLTGAHDGLDLCAAGPIRLLAGERPCAVRSGPRVGVRRGADLAWRWWIADEPTVSQYRPAAPRRRPA